jgi:hypothetical protein
MPLYNKPPSDSKPPSPQNVILSEGRRQPNAVEGPLRDFDRHRFQEIFHSGPQPPKRPGLTSLLVTFGT